MWNTFEFLRGPVRHMKLIGTHPTHRELRERNEARLAALKDAGKLTEADHEKPASLHLDRCLESFK